MMDEILKERIRILEEHVKKYLRMPTIRQLKTLRGVSGVQTIYNCLTKLKELGYLTDKGEPTDMLRGYKMFENVRAGYFTPAPDTTTASLTIEQFLVPHATQCFLVKVKGDSMKDAGLIEGDYVIVDYSKKNPRNGDMIIAMMDDGMTVKFFRKEGDQIRLQPANDNYAPIYPDGERYVQGTVIGSFRKYE